MGLNGGTAWRGDHDKKMPKFAGGGPQRTSCVRGADGVTKGALDGVKEDGAGVMGRYCGRTGKWGESRNNGRAMGARALEAGGAWPSRASGTQLVSASAFVPGRHLHNCNAT